MTEEMYIAVVQKVLTGDHGLYVVATLQDESLKIGSVTFPLSSPVWTESCPPEEGTYVVLSKLTKKRAGWRAQLARFYTPSDQARSKQQ